MDDILFSVPWSCGGIDACDQRWHITNYWIYSDGTYSADRYGDGDTHEDIEEKDLPSHKEQDEAWDSYWSFVAQTGKDPLGQVISTSTKKTIARRWQAKITRWVGGLKVIGLRRNARGPFLSPKEAPEEVRQFLLLNAKDSIEDDEIKTFEQLKECQGLKKWRMANPTTLHLSLVIDETVVRSEAAIKRHNKKIAKQHFEDRRSRKEMSRD